MSQSKSSIFHFKIFILKNFLLEFGNFFWPAHSFWRLRERTLRICAFIFWLQDCAATKVCLRMHGLHNNIECIFHYYCTYRTRYFAQKCTHLCAFLHAVCRFDCKQLFCYYFAHKKYSNKGICVLA